MKPSVLKYLTRTYWWDVIRFILSLVYRSIKRPYCLLFLTNMSSVNIHRQHGFLSYRRKHQEHPTKGCNTRVLYLFLLILNSLRQFGTGVWRTLDTSQPVHVPPRPPFIAIERSCETWRDEVKYVSFFFLTRIFLLFMCVPKKLFYLFPIIHWCRVPTLSFIHRNTKLFRTTRNIMKTQPHFFSGQLISRKIQLSFITLIYNWKWKLSFRSRVLSVIMG